MNNFKKVGLSALAGSLVAFSANAGEISVAGSAGMYLEHINGGAANSGKSFSMDNQLTFTGGGELDNGLNVSVSFVIDQGDDTTTSVGAGTLTFGGGAPFDSHSVTVSSDSFGSITMHGEGMSSASGALDGMPSGDIWDAFQAAADEPEAAPGGAGGLSYAFPSMMDGLALTASYTPSNGNADSSTALGAVYTGVEGLTVTYAVGSDNNNATSEADHTVMKATYAYGPITVGYGHSEYDDSVADGDQETEAFSIAYTISDELSVTYGVEEISNGKAGEIDAEYEKLSASYTPSGGTTEVESSSDYGIELTNLMDGLTVGAAQGEDNSAAATIETTTMYVKFAMEEMPITVGYQATEDDSETASADVDFSAIGASYAISSDMSVSINSSTHDYEDASLSDQEALGISLSYTMGSMTLSANHNSIDNLAGDSAKDRSGYAMSVGFAF